jgi:hypothetical protein
MNINNGGIEAGDQQDDQALAGIEIDLLEFAEQGKPVPHAPIYRVHIDGEIIKVHTPRPTGEELLHKVHKQPCAFELIAEFRDHENCVIEPHEKIDLQRPGLKRFITAHKEIVTIFINNDPYKIERGEHTVAQILQKVGQTPEGYVLLEEKGGPPLPVPPTVPVKICGCEVFFTQPQSGASS